MEQVQVRTVSSNANDVSYTSAHDSPTRRLSNQSMDGSVDVDNEFDDDEYWTETEVSEAAPEVAMQEEEFESAMEVSQQLTPEQQAAHAEWLRVRQESHRDVITSNNRGQALLESGDCVQAVSVLSSSLRVCRQLMAEAEDIPSDIPTTMDRCMTESLPQGQCNRDFSTLHSNTNGFIYRHAIRIPLDVGDCYRSCVMVSTLVTFNLALANHLTALQTAAVDLDVARQILVKASKLYELAYSMQQEENFESNTWFTLASVNNLGMIHSTLHLWAATPELPEEQHVSEHSASADQCFDYLLSTLMYLTDSGTLEPNGDFVHILDGLFRNATTSCQPSKLAPAA